MAKELRKIRVTPGGELDQAVQQAAAGPVLLEREGELFRLSKEPAPGEKPDIWANYDPEKARRALESIRGILAGVDTEKLIAQIHEERGQDSQGRPGD